MKKSLYTDYAFKYLQVKDITICCNLKELKTPSNKQSQPDTLPSN